MGFDYPFSSTTDDDYLQQLQRARDGLLSLVSDNVATADPTTPFNYQRTARSDTGKVRRFIPGTGHVDEGPLGVDWTTESLQVFQGQLWASNVWFLPAISTRRQFTRVIIVSDTASAGSDGSNRWEFDLFNVTQGVSMFTTQPTTEGAEIAANAAYVLVPDTNVLAEALDVVEVRVTATGSPTTLSRASIVVEGVLAA